MRAATVTEIRSRTANSLNPLRPAWLPPMPKTGPAPEDTPSAQWAPASPAAPAVGAVVAPSRSDSASAAAEGEAQDSTLALLEDADPAIRSFYSRILPRGASPTACVPYWPCA